MPEGGQNRWPLEGGQNRWPSTEPSRLLDAHPPMVRGSCAQLGGGTTTASPVAPAPREVQHMSHLARGGFAAMFAALALLVGTPRRAGATPNNANCKPNRATCTANNQCCSGACTAGLCAT